MNTIINAHTHLIDLRGMRDKYGDVLLPSGIAVLEDLDAALRLLDPLALVGQMDEAGISQSVLFAVQAPLVYASNEYVSHLCERFPNRFIGFASVNPKTKDAPEILQHAVEKLGLRGLKLHPPLQAFFPDSPEVYPVYEKAVELDIPVVFHVGTTPFGSLCRLAHANPIHIDEVAVRFPTLRIQLTHLGTLWHNEALMVVEKNPNVFIDTAAYLYELPQILTPDTIARVGEGKFIFGTDYPMPYTNQPHRMNDFVKAIRALKLSDSFEKAVFQDNFLHLLNGSEAAEAQGVTLGYMIAQAESMGAIPKVA